MMAGAAGMNVSPRTLHVSASPRRIEAMLEELSSVRDIHVSVNRAFGSGWNAEHVQPGSRKGGIEYSVYFVQSSGSFDGGVTFPPGSGNPL